MHLSPGSSDAPFQRGPQTAFTPAEDLGQAALISRSKSLVVVDGQRGWRQGLVAFLDHRPDVAVVAEAGDVEQAMRVACSHRPTLALVAVDTTVHGERLLRRLDEEVPGILCVAVVTRATPNLLASIMATGAAALVTRDTPLEVLVDVLLTARRGEFRAVAMLQPDPPPVPAPSPADSFPSDLSHRQREVLRLVALGFTSKEISAQLGIGPTTVDTYRHRAMRRLGMKNRSDLVRYARDLGLLGVTPSG